VIHADWGARVRFEGPEKSNVKEQGGYFQSELIRSTIIDNIVLKLLDEL
jgi:hypothetical protein